MIKALVIYGKEEETKFFLRFGLKEDSQAERHFFNRLFKKAVTAKF